MSEGSKCLHLNEDLFCVKSMIPRECWLNCRTDYSSQVILATEPSEGTEIASEGAVTVALNSIPLEA